MVKFKDLFSFKKKEIDKVFEAALRKTSMLGIKLLFSPANKNQKHGKLLIIISSLSGKAHERNKVRRQIKNIFFEEQLYTVPGNWILQVYKEAMNLNFNQIRNFLLNNIKHNESK
ncbi:ribonuclease P protein component [Candidatus Babeliales bacterium]|nr:ribonuclease P protein component [Candidatus Babeliales bacterium]